MNKLLWNIRGTQNKKSQLYLLIFMLYLQIDAAF